MLLGKIDKIIIGYAGMASCAGLFIQIIALFLLASRS